MAPVLETLAIFSVISRGAKTKKDLARAAIVITNSLEEETPIFLCYIDSLVCQGLVYRHDFKYYLTESGAARHVFLKDYFLPTFLARLS